MQQRRRKNGTGYFIILRRSSGLQRQMKLLRVVLTHVKTKDAFSRHGIFRISDGNREVRRKAHISLA